MLVRIECPECGVSVRVDTELAKRELRARVRYAFGDHVSDQRAFAIRLMRIAGYGALLRLGKSTATMLCVAHREAPDIP